MFSKEMGHAFSGFGKKGEKDKLKINKMVKKKKKKRRMDFLFLRQ